MSTVACSRRAERGEPVVPVPVEVPLGYRAGRWRVGEHIASGSWGSVYAASAATPNGPGDAALKFLPGRALTRPQHEHLTETLRQEVRFSERADHPRLIRTFETFVVEDEDNPDVDGAIVLAMERAQRSLSEWLSDDRPLDDAERIAAEICSALTHVHELGWIHGDLKPSNVLLMDDGSVRLADFGLTRELEGSHAYAPRVGSSDYLPPEWWNERVSEQGIRTRTTADIWAFGVTAHQLLTGGLFPFPGATARARGYAAQAYAEGRAPLRLADEVPQRWRAIIADCLAPDHRRRLPHTAASIQARISAPAAATSGRQRLGRLAAIGGAGAVVLAAGTLAWLDTRSGHDAGPTATLTVYNAEKRCQRSLSDECRLGLAGDPEARYGPANIVAHARHGDRLVAECFVAGAWPVVAEDGRQSRTWYRVRVGDELAWLPGSRIAADARPRLKPCPS